MYSIMIESKLQNTFTDIKIDYKNAFFFFIKKSFYLVVRLSMDFANKYLLSKSQEPVSRTVAFTPITVVNLD